MSDKLLQPDVDIMGACLNLREHVNGLTGGDPRKIHTVKVMGVEIGYRRSSHLTYRRREVFIKVPGHRIEDLSEEERDQILAAVFDVYLIEGAAMPEISSISTACIRIKQDYIPMIPVERSPGLVSIAGGIGK